MMQKLALAAAFAGTAQCFSITPHAVTLPGAPLSAPAAFTLSQPPMRAVRAPDATMAALTGDTLMASLKVRAQRLRDTCRLPRYLRTSPTIVSAQLAADAHGHLWRLVRYLLGRRE